MEDARFVRLFEENGDFTYYATYTAYNGFELLPILLKTTNFQSFVLI